MSDPFLDSAYARLGAQLFGGQARLDSSPGKSLAGQPCPPGVTAAKTGCVRHDKKGNRIAESSGVERAANVHRRKAAIEAVENLGERTTGGIAGKVAGPLERARQVAHVAEHTGVDKATASALIDRKEGKAMAGRTKTYAEAREVFFRNMARMVPAEIEHFDHELAKAGVHVGLGGQDRRARVVRGALIAGYMVAKTALWATGTHGPVGMAAHAAGHIADAISNVTGADAIVSMNLIHQVTKIGLKSLGAGVKLLRKGMA